MSQILAFLKIIQLDLSYLEYYRYQIGEDVLYRTMYWWIIEVEIRDYLSGSYGFMDNEKWHLAKSLIDVRGICLVVDDKQ